MKNKNSSGPRTNYGSEEKFSPGDPVFTNGSLKIDFAAGCAYLSDEELHLTPIEYNYLSPISLKPHNGNFFGTGID